MRKDLQKRLRERADFTADEGIRQLYWEAAAAIDELQDEVNDLLYHWWISEFEGVVALTLKYPERWEAKKRGRHSTVRGAEGRRVVGSGQSDPDLFDVE